MGKDIDRVIRVGVVGVGHLGQHHARIYSEMEGVELVGVADTDSQRLREIISQFKTTPFPDHRELFGKVDAVSVAVPTTFHYRVAKEFLDRGVDVLVEKPIAETVAEADDLLRAAQRRDRILQVGHIERFNGAVQVLSRLVEEPRFIECHRLGPFAARGTDVDVVLDLMIHDIDIILSLVNSPVKQVNAVGVPVISEQVDIANARIQFESGCVANVTASRVSAERLRKIRIFQKDTYISLDYAHQEVVLYRRIPPEYGGSRLPQIVKEEVPVEKREPLRAELVSFIDCVRTRRPPLVSGKEGRQALAVAAEIIKKI
ncbi:MAG: Gfo/Idh/MocA family oxidoreductase [candidate division NC10 bacterium]|nr:Gfo/Idh/MocA family oxidoreductase [candidate division NC10 bacterium]